MRHEAVTNGNDSDQGRKLKNVLRKLALTNVIKQPTRITETTKGINSPLNRKGQNQNC